MKWKLLKKYPNSKTYRFWGGIMLLSDGLNHITRLGGNVLRIRYFTENLGSVWDDDRTITASGNNLYLSGIILKIDATRGSEDQVLLEQGRIRYDDSKIFINGSIQTTSGQQVFTIAISGTSATERVYREIEQGVSMPQYFGTNIYKKIYCREIPLGSLF